MVYVYLVYAGASSVASTYDNFMTVSLGKPFPLISAGRIFYDFSLVDWD